MPNLEKLKGAAVLASNTPGMPTGYGNQGMQLAERMIRSGLEFAALSNYGLEGQKTTMRIAGKDIQHYPKGLNAYSTDVMPIWTEDFARQHPDLKTVLFTLYDVWVYNDLQYDGPIVSWVPLDHITPPPAVMKFLKRENLTAVAMSKFGQEQLESQGIQSTYIPHGIDTKVFKPTTTIKGMPAREFMGVPDDTFLVGMVAANKANGQIHRKAFGENLLAFAAFHKRYPNSQIYIHTEPSRAYGGFNLASLLHAVGLDKSAVLLPDPVIMRTGYEDEVMAGLYSAFDVLLNTSYGEGFGVPTVEAQACGTRVITSNFAASKDLVSEDSYLVDGQPFWDEAQQCFFQIPAIKSITTHLEKAYHEGRGHSQASVNFAKEFDADHIFRWRWLPFLKELYK
jgi:glycosyltransferase involved in cell wall biosynthesis